MSCLSGAPPTLHMYSLKHIGPFHVNSLCMLKLFTCFNTFVIFAYICNTFAPRISFLLQSFFHPTSASSTPYCHSSVMLSEPLEIPIIIMVAFFCEEFSFIRRTIHLWCNDRAAGMSERSTKNSSSEFSSWEPVEEWRFVEEGGDDPNTGPH